MLAHLVLQDCPENKTMAILSYYLLNRKHIYMLGYGKKIHRASEISELEN